MGQGPTLLHENGLSCPCRALGSVGTGHWYPESAHQLTGELPAPRIVAASTPSKVVTRTFLRAPASLSPVGGAMERVLERCVGLDVHKKTVTACVRVPGNHGGRAQHVRTFGTTTAELLTLRDWLEAHHVTHVAMESTGVYWRPVCYVLEEAFTCILANATQIAQVPGRRTTVNAAWGTDQLFESGLVRASFVPPPPIRELRDLTRYRKLLIQERTRHANRLHKVLEDTGIKLTSVATRLLGASGRAMLEALVAGTTDPDVLADPARGKLRKKLPALRQALLGHFRAHHAFLVSQLLAHLDYLDEAIETVSTQIDGAMAPFAELLGRLDTIRGVNKRTAEVLIAELGHGERVRHRAVQTLERQGYRVTLEPAA